MSDQDLESSLLKDKDSRRVVLPIEVEHRSPWQREMAKETREDDRFV